ncbi:predicted protein [Nematostella vectensis]|uniref:G-protein coupled receptors family 1 profile domain-containing protein n=2 Tax=Nematostella vectensis TaxID=45351 RepID=A7SPH3_NEMVE|nr:predicted protein [Nematostella vectensis]|eukprot:XP_001626509.1 predicted protein [Nematostella vectensis]
MPSYTLQEVLTQPSVLALVLFEICLFVIAVVGNVLVCRTIYLTRRLHFSAYYFIASMSTADLCLTLLVLPVSTAYYVTYQMRGAWIFGKAMCHMWTLASSWFATASIFNLCAVTWDRYVAMTTPFRYYSRMRSSRVILMIGAAWMTSFILALMTSYGYQVSDTRILCEMQGIKLVYAVVNFVVTFVAPSFVLIFANAKIWTIAARRMNRVEAYSTTTLPAKFRRKWESQDIKMFRTFLIIIGTFLVSFTPCFIVILLDPLGVRVPGFLAYLFVVLTYINSALEPLIYGLFNKDFRKAVVASLKRRPTHARSKNVHLSSTVETRNL